MPESRSAHPNDAVHDVDSPQVIVDFDFDDGLLYVRVTNLGPEPAYDIHVTFDGQMHGLGGERVVNEMAMFSRLLFLGPGREIRTLVDEGAAYFGRDEPTRLAATVTYRLPGGVRQRSTIRHDLSVYRDLAYSTKGA